jgi:hypothetical protein
MTGESTGTRPRFWVSELLATLMGIYTLVLLAFALFLSEESLAKMELSVPLCVGGAIALAVLCGVFTMQAAIDRRADDVTTE